jgi:hypothetical protein
VYANAAFLGSFVLVKLQVMIPRIFPRPLSARSMREKMAEVTKVDWTSRRSGRIAGYLQHPASWQFRDYLALGRSSAVKLALPSPRFRFLRHWPRNSMALRNQIIVIRSSCILEAYRSVVPLRRGHRFRPCRVSCVVYTKGPTQPPSRCQSVWDSHRRV